MGYCGIFEDIWPRPRQNLVRKEFCRILFRPSWKMWMIFQEVSCGRLSWELKDTKRQIMLPKFRRFFSHLSAKHFAGIWLSGIMIIKDMAQKQWSPSAAWLGAFAHICGTRTGQKSHAKCFSRNRDHKHKWNENTITQYPRGHAIFH